MKYFKVFLPWVLFLIIASPSLATDEEALKQKVASNFERLITRSKIQEPSQDIVTRSPGGSKLYRSASNGIVLVFTANDTMGSGVVLSNSGLVVTNWHVVENEPRVGIIFKEATRQDRIPLQKEDIFIAKVLKTDPIRDLALLQIVSIPRNLTVLRLGSMLQVDGLLPK